jgi:hypothetical protein
LLPCLSSALFYLPYFALLFLPCPALPGLHFLASPCQALPGVALPRLALPCLVLPCLASPCLALPSLALPCLALSRFCLPYLASLCFTLPRFALLFMCLALPLATAFRLSPLDCRLLCLVRCILPLVYITSNTLSRTRRLMESFLTQSPRLSSIAFRISPRPFVTPL